MIIFAETIFLPHATASQRGVLFFELVVVKFLTVGVGRCAGARERRAGLCGPISRRMHEERLGAAQGPPAPRGEAERRGARDHVEDARRLC